MLGSWNTIRCRLLPIPVSDAPLVPPPPFEDVEGEEHQNAGNVTPPVCVLEDNGEDWDGAESDGTVFYSMKSGSA